MYDSCSFFLAHTYPTHQKALALPLTTTCVEDITLKQVKIRRPSGEEGGWGGEGGGDPCHALRQGSTLS